MANDDTPIVNPLPMDDQASQWETLNSTRIYENPWIELYHDDVLRPDGSTGIYGHVHFKGCAVGIVALDDDDNIFLVRQSRYTLNEKTWEIPEGGASKNEEPIMCAKRELEEETGLVAKHWQRLLKIHTSNSITDELGFVYLATDLSEGLQCLDETEDIEVKKFALSEALKMVFSQEITDAMSVAGILAAYNQKEQNN